MRGSCVQPACAWRLGGGAKAGTVAPPPPWVRPRGPPARLAPPPRLVRPVPPAAALRLLLPASLPPGFRGREQEKVLLVGGRGAARVLHPGAPPARAARGLGGPCIRRRLPPRWISVRTACSATWTTCRSSPSSRGRSAGASRCAPGRRNCRPPSRPLPEAAWDPLGVLLQSPVTVSP